MMKITTITKTMTMTLTIQRISQTNKMSIMVMIMVTLMMILVICGSMSKWRILPGGGTLDGNWVTLKSEIMQWSAKKIIALIFRL